MPSFFDEVKSGLGALLDRVAGDEDGPIRELTPQQLREELAAREAKRASRNQAEPDIKHPIAKRAGSGKSARTARKKMAAEREGRVRGARKQREDANRRAQQAAFEEAKRRAEQEARRAASSARRSSSGGRSSSRGSSRSGGSSRSRSRSRGASRGGNEIAEHYKTLDLPVGAEFSEVKSQFRKLMRKYHPDMHSATPEKQKAAAELSKKFTVAYNALEEHLKS